MINSQLKNHPIFIFGTQRSGTTLLCRMLSAHPDLFIQNELNVRQIFRPNLSKEEILKNIFNLIEEEHGETLDVILHKNNKLHWGLKDPELTYHINDIEKFIPQSKVIIIVRDGRAVVNSYMENKWGLGTNAYTGAQRWSEEVKKQLAFVDHYPENVFLLKYEDLIDNMERELRRVCNYLELPFHEDLINYNKKPTFYHQTRENITTFGQPKPAMAIKWQKKLSAKEIGIIEEVGSEILKKLNYSNFGKPYLTSSIEKKYYKLHQLIIGELQIQYRWRMSMIREYFRKKSLKKTQIVQKY